MHITVTFESLEEFNSMFNKTVPTLSINGEAKMQAPCMLANGDTWEPEAEPEDAPVEEPKKEEATKSTPKKEKAKDEAQAKPAVSITEVRKLIHKKIQEEGKKKEVQELLNEFGVKSLTSMAETCPEKLADFYERAKEAL